MRDLIVKLSTVDGCAEDALRVIDHFDTMVDQRASALALLRAAAALADCPVGFDDPERGMRVGVDGDGRPLAAVDGVPAHRQVRRFGTVTVWLDRDGAAWPLDGLILERFARSLHAVKPVRDTSPGMAALRAVCDADASALDRDRALRYLSLGSTVTVLVLHAADAGSWRGALIQDEYAIHLFPEDATVTLPCGVAGGLHTCAAADVHREWRRAAIALRVAIDVVTGAPIAVRYGDLGSIATLVDHIDGEAARQAPDVRVLEALQAQRPWVVPTLGLLSGHTSIREVARLQNLHHSTLRQRIDWLERNLGYAPLSGDGLVRTAATLTLWRIAIAGAARGAVSPVAAAG